MDHLQEVAGRPPKEGFIGEVLIRGADNVGDNTLDIPTAGTAVQLPDVVVKRVIIQANEGNGGTVVVGGENVVAAVVGRRGMALFATQAQVFYVNNLNKLFVDSTTSGDDIHYYYEV